MAEDPSTAVTPHSREVDLTEPVAQPGSMDRLALHLSLAFLFFRISYLHEVITSKIHVDLHLLMLLGGASCAAVIASGKWANAVRDRNARIWFGFVVCLFFSTLGSSWRGGSLPIFLTYVRTTLPLLLLIPAVVASKADLLKVIGTMGWAGLATIAVGFMGKEYKDGRMTLMTAPSIGDSNDYAAQIIFVLPVIIYALFIARKSILRRLIGFVVIPAGLYQILSTGSRGALVSGCLTVMLVFFISRPKVKMALLLGLPSIALLITPFVPSQSMDRLATLFQSDEEKSSEAADSAEARRRLLQQSITLTFHHPLLGVGLGQFLNSEGELAREQGHKGMWHETHNTYTQVSCEVGIPALLCFVTALGVTMKRLWKARSSNDTYLAGIAQVIFISTFGFCVAVFFLSHAYGFAFLISTSLAIAIDQLLARRAVPETEDAAPNPLPTRVPGKASNQLPVRA